ncbi:hypothetical protein [Deinococcus planocerae]|uniref:hypothetical protein n=1 Tax=Deinococcus planocerae TaxID=1737569 RepID=UPI000C7EB75E|nr:hypothetical protein [Deinococcus planocerae]
MTSWAYWAELVELYEYRVADVLAGRTPRGGRRALAELRDTLLGAPLEPALHRRLLKSDREYRAGLDPRRVERAGAEPGSSPAWSAPAAGDSPETRAWEELRRLAWHADLRGRVVGRTRALRDEPGRLTLRVLYAALENAERAARGVAEPLAVPAEHDPLVSLHDPEVAGRLALAWADALLTSPGRSRVRAALWAVHEAPFPRHPDEDLLGARLQAAEREPLAPQAREALVQALRASSPAARDPRERPAIRDAARRLQTLLGELLEGAPAPDLGVMPARSVLYAAQPPAALPAPDDRTDELALHLAGGREAHWRGLELRWHAVGPHWQFQAGDALALLQPHLPPTERAWTLPTPQGELRLFLSGAYLLLRLERSAPASGEGPGHLAARARAVARLLDPEGAHANLRLARAAAQLLRGAAVDAAALGPGSARRYVGAPPGTLLPLARKGVDALTTHLARLTPVETEAALQDGAALLGLPAGRALALHDVLHAATFTPEPLPAPSPASRLDVPASGAFVSVRLGEGPVTLHVRGRVLTLRREDGEHPVAALPGEPAVPLHDLLVLPVGGAQVLLVRQGTWVAAAVEAPGGAGEAP